MTYRVRNVPLPPSLAGYIAERLPTYRPDRAVVGVEQRATGIRGRSTGRTIEEALAGALRLCRARQRMHARGLLPQPNAGDEPPPVRDIDVTTADGAARLDAMLGGDIAAR